VVEWLARWFVGRQSIRRATSDRPTRSDAGHTVCIAWGRTAAAANRRAVPCPSVRFKESDVRTQLHTRRIRRLAVRQGKIGWIILWLLGVPIPLLLVLFLIRGCT
jgi:hypothetical protein